MTDTHAPSTAQSRTHYWAWKSAREQPHHHYLVPAVVAALGPPAGRRLLDVGCGNGALTAKLAAAGFAVTGIDFEPTGIALAQAAHAGIDFARHDVTEPLPEELRGRYDVVVAAEVIEHLFLPREVFARAREALVPGGCVVVTTPYHGYLKNLAIAVSGRFDDHVGPLGDFGHIKFFSKKTLGEMARQCGFEPDGWRLAGRVPPLAASMVMRAVRRADGGRES